MLLLKVTDCQIDENVCILHGTLWNMVLDINEKYETLSIYTIMFIYQ